MDILFSYLIIISIIFYFILVILRLPKYKKIYKEKENNIALKKTFLKKIRLIKKGLNPKLLSKITIFNTSTIKENGSLTTDSPYFEIRIEPKNLISYEKTQFFTGDTYFDQNNFILNVNMEEMTARLSNDVRNKILLISKQGFDISINYNTIFIGCNNPEFILNDKNINQIKWLIEKIYLPIDLENAYIKNIKNEKTDEIRIKNLNLLVASDNINNHENFLLSLLNDKCNMISIIAAGSLKSKGLNYLIKTLEKGYLNQYETEKIISYLKNFCNEKKVLNAFYKLLENPDKNENLINKIINILKNNKDTKSINYVLKFIEINNNIINSSYELQNTIIDYLGDFKIKKGINYLISLLDSDDEIKIAVINSLSKIKDIKTVQYLLPLTKGILNPANVKKAAKEAIQKIQADIPEDQKGDLTLTEIEKAGELSMENNEEKSKGDLSIDGD